MAALRGTGTALPTERRPLREPSGPTDPRLELFNVSLIPFIVIDVNAINVYN